MRRTMNDTPSDIRTDRRSGTLDFRAAPEAPGALAPRQRHPVRAAIGFLLLLLFIAAVVWVVVERSRTPANFRRFAAGPIPVGVATVTKGDLPVELSALGTATPLATVTVQSQISGQLVAVGFQEGQLVKKGDFLAQIDPRPYQAALEQAQGQLGKDEAALNNARVDLNRYNTLVAQNSIATQTRDTQVALVAQDVATVKADQAAIDTQKLNLVYCHIVSPVDGRVGLRQIDPGNYVTPSEPNGLVVVTQLQPISVIFTLPEDDLPTVMQQLHAGASLTTTAYDRTGTTKLAEGKLETVDNQIDPTTGTVKLRATFPNTEETLFPNQFVNVRLLVNTLRGAEIVPVAAIQRGAPGTFVYVVGADDTVEIAKVQLGSSNGQHVAILKGVQDGQKVVVDGADRLKVGAKVSIVPPPGAATQASTAPQPGGQHRRRQQQKAP
jgi:membrane fusion protein, multidrug efflux system